MDSIPAFDKDIENQLREYCEKHAEEKFLELVRNRILYTISYYTPMGMTPFGPVPVGEADHYAVGASSLLLGYILGKRGVPLYPTETTEYILDKYYSEVEVDL